MKYLMKLVLPGDIFSPGYFIVRGVVILVLFGLAHLAGWRVFTTFLSGTIHGVDPQAALILGTVYLLLYFGSVVVTPILLLAAAILMIFRRRTIHPTKGDQGNPVTQPL